MMWKQALANMGVGGGVATVDQDGELGLGSSLGKRRAEELDSAIDIDDL